MLHAQEGWGRTSVQNNGNVTYKGHSAFSRTAWTLTWEMLGETNLGSESGITVSSCILCRRNGMFFRLPPDKTSTLRQRKGWAPPEVTSRDNHHVILHMTEGSASRSRGVRTVGDVSLAGGGPWRRHVHDSIMPSRLIALGQKTQNEDKYPSSFDPLPKPRIIIINHNLFRLPASQTQNVILTEAVAAVFYVCRNHFILMLCRLIPFIDISLLSVEAEMPWREREVIWLDEIHAENFDSTWFLIPHDNNYCDWLRWNIDSTG